MKLLILSRYGPMGASSRLRALQYRPSLEAAGIVVEVSSFFDDAYLQALYAGRREPIKTIGYYLSRMRKLISYQKPDVIWLEKEGFPWLPFFIEKAIFPKGVPIVSDYDDAVFHRYDQHTNSIIRNLLGSKIDAVMAASDLVMAGNAYLAEHSLKAGAQRVEIIPTVVDITAYSTIPQPASDGRPRIGWIGTPTTWRAYGTPMVPMLADLATEHSALVRVVGAGQEAPTDKHFENLPWSEKTESDLIQGMDVGLMPLDDSPWSRGKCGYKLIQYMACGLPVVASPVGVNSDIVEHGVNGFLASTEAEWREALNTLLCNKELRQRMGAKGRKRVEARYSIQVYGPKVAGLLHEVVQASRSK